jgi:hypothetical protein
VMVNSFTKVPVLKLISLRSDRKWQDIRKHFRSPPAPPLVKGGLGDLLGLVY